MVEHIKTHKVLNNSYFSGEKSEKMQQDTSSMQVSPLVSEQYDYALTDDISALYEQDDNDRKLMEIYENAPFYKPVPYQLDADGNKVYELIKIDKKDIPEIFNYMNNEFIKVKKIRASERFKAINEFFGFNYEYVYKNVLTPKFKSEILNDYYRDGSMRRHIDECVSEKLF